MSTNTIFFYIYVQIKIFILNLNRYYDWFKQRLKYLYKSTKAFRDYAIRIA